MKMIKRYAIEPRALKRWEDFRYIMEKLGFSEGRVLVALPKHWIRELLDSLSDVGEIERMRFTTRLQKYKADRIVPSGSDYDRLVTWVDNAARLKACGIVEDLIVSKESLSAAYEKSYTTPEIIDEEFFSAPREMRCLGTSQNLANAASVLMDFSSEARFVDPYFKVASPSCLQTIGEFLRHASTNRRCNDFQVFTKSDFVPKSGLDRTKKIFDQLFSDVARAGFRIRIHFIEQHSSQVTFHARYLLTNKGGIRYDKGFCSANPPEVFDISLIDRKLHGDLLEIFRADNAELGILETWEWVAGTT